MASRKKRAFDFRNLDFKTTSTRDGDVAWLHLDALDGSRTWAHVTAHVHANDVQITTTPNVRALHLDGVGAPPFPALSPTVIVDHATLVFDEEEPRALHREDGVWKKGSLASDSLQKPIKQGHVTGPIRDVFHEPIVFVYGAQSPEGSAANEAVARGFARIRGGIDVHYSVMSDVEFLAKKESLEKERALFLVGNTKENALVAMMDDAFPIHVEGDHVRAGDKIFSSEETGAMFIRPNPKHPSSYVVVVEAPTPLGTMRALSLPDMLPDFVVYDRHVAPSRYQLLLGAGSLLAGGIFTSDWSLPPNIDDPLAKSPRKKPQNEHDATPYLP